MFTATQVRWVGGKTVQSDWFTTRKFLCLSRKSYPHGMRRLCQSAKQIKLQKMVKADGQWSANWKKCVTFTCRSIYPPKSMMQIVYNPPIWAKFISFSLFLCFFVFWLPLLWPWCICVSCLTHTGRPTYLASFCFLVMSFVSQLFWFWAAVFL